MNETEFAGSITVTLKRCEQQVGIISKPLGFEMIPEGGPRMDLPWEAFANLKGWLFPRQDYEAYTVPLESGGCLFFVCFEGPGKVFGYEASDTHGASTGVWGGILQYNGYQEIVARLETDRIKLELPEPTPLPERRFEPLEVDEARYFKLGRPVEWVGLNFHLDGEPTKLSLSWYQDTWTINIMGATETCYHGSTFEKLCRWREKARTYDGAVFSDTSDEGPTGIAVVLLQEKVLLAYQGFEGCWAGFITYTVFDAMLAYVGGFTDPAWP